MWLEGEGQRGTERDRAMMTGSFRRGFAIPVRHQIFLFGLVLSREAAQPDLHSKQPPSLSCAEGTQVGVVVGGSREATAVLHPPAQQVWRIHLTRWQIRCGREKTTSRRGVAGPLVWGSSSSLRAWGALAGFQAGRAGVPLGLRKPARRYRVDAESSRSRRPGQGGGGEGGQVGLPAEDAVGRGGACFLLTCGLQPLARGPAPAPPPPGFLHPP